jgi:CRP-like cAMP-binding protein
VLTLVERVLILKGADLLSDVGPRRLLALAEVAREIEIVKGDTIYGEEDPADVLYTVVEGRVRLSTGERVLSEVGPGESFGTWALVDDSARGHRAECVEDGLALAQHRDEFYDVAASDLELLQEVVRALAKRLRALVAERPEEARVEGEGIEKPEALVAAEQAAAAAEPTVPADPASATAPQTPGEALAAAALGKEPAPGEAPVKPPEPFDPPGKDAAPERAAPLEPPQPTPPPKPQ